MRPEEEMILCFVKAGALMRSLTFCIMGAADTSKAFDEFLTLADKIRPFIKQATGKDDEAVADLAMDLIQNERLAAAFVRDNVAALAS